MDKTRIVVSFNYPERENVSQGPWLMITREWYNENTGEVIGAEVLHSEEYASDCVGDYVVEELSDDFPRYEHDCTECKFLGQYQNSDLYFCPQGNYPTVIARFSSYSPDYHSGLEAGKSGLIDELHEAYKRAVERGFLVNNSTPLPTKGVYK